MIVAKRKALDEIISKIASHKKVMIAGCATCVAECHAGGQKEVDILGSQLRIYFKKTDNPIIISECCVERQCEPDLIEKMADDISGHDAILALSCGVGVQEMAKRFTPIPVYPGLNTTFMGTHAGPGIWEERCAGCGECLLDLTGGICPIARCGKSLLNGPCGGSNNGNCEISDETKCAWAAIVERLDKMGKLENLKKTIPPKDWSTARDGGPRKLVKEEIDE